MSDIKQSNAYRVFDELAGKLEVIDNVKILVDAVIDENEQLKTDKDALQAQVDTLALEILTLMGV